jgi:NAD(P)-dependent dehydrogenase (short-subunit alcohol dehydrogenase family)
VTLLREGLLAGRSIATAGPLRGELPATLERLGAQLEPIDESLDDEAAAHWAGSRPGLDAVVYDAAGPFGDGGARGLMAAIERGWPAVRAVTAGALIPAGAGGRIVLIAPAADAHPHARAAGAALENMARTLSTEWARHAITVTAIVPGADTSDADVATLAAFLLSPGGGYFSGCKLELDGLTSVRS